MQLISYVHFYVTQCSSIKSKIKEQHLDWSQEMGRDENRENPTQQSPIYVYKYK